MTHTEEARATSLRLYQVNYQDIGSPVLVVAPTASDARAFAVVQDANGSDHQTTVVVDVTADFLELSLKAGEHTKTLLSAGKAGIVDYDDEEGWLLRAV